MAERLTASPSCMRPWFEPRRSCVGFSEKYPYFFPLNVTGRSR